MRIKDLKYFIKIDTNGCFPKKLKEIVNLGLVDFVSMDIKTSKENYKEIVESDVDLEKIEQSIKLISQLPNYEFRTTVVLRFHDKEEIEKIAQWLNQVCEKKPQKFCLQGFKKQEKLIDESFKQEHEIEMEKLEEMKEKVNDFFEEVEVRG